MSDSNMMAAALVVYMALLVAIGLWSARGSRGRRAFFLAGRDLDTVRTTATLSATVIGGSATIVAVIFVFSNGLAGIWLTVAGGLGLLVLSLTLAPKVRALGAYSLPDIAGKLYDGRVRFVTSALVLLAEVAWLSLLIQACMVVVYMFADVQVDLALALITGVFMGYTLMGGQRAVAFSDMLQWGMMLLGFCFILLPAVLMAVGGPAALFDSLPAERKTLPTSDLVTPVAAVSSLLLLGLSHVVGPDVYSKLLSARDERTARRSAFLAGCAGIAFGVTLTLLALCAWVIYDGEVDAPAMILPMLMTDHLHPALAGLLAAALLAVLMSSADSILLTSGTVAAHDIYAPLKKRLGGGRGREVTGEEEVRFGKAAMIFVGISAYLLALAFQDIIDTLELAYTVFSAGVIIPVIAGFYREHTRVNPVGAMGGMLAGGAVSLMLTVEELREMSGVDSGPLAELFSYPPILVGILFCILGILVFNPLHGRFSKA